MANDVFVAKLDQGGLLGPRERDALRNLAQNGRAVARGHHLIRQGDRPEVVFLVLRGWAVRYKLTPDGQRQILGMLLPGDLCHPQNFVLDAMDHGIVMVSDGEIVAIPKSRMVEITATYPAIDKTLWWSTLVDESILREWLFSVGSRDSYAQLAHLFCELHTRMAGVGLATGGRCAMPLTQTDLGEVLGISAVHVNRVVQRLRGDGLIALGRGELHIKDLARLCDVAGFDDAYLHRRPRAEHDLLVDGRERPSPRQPSGAV